MRNGSSGPWRKLSRGWRWGTLALGAFLAGLLAVGLVILAPGGGDREEEPPSPFAPSRPPSNGPPAPSPASRPATPRLAIVVDDLGYDPSADAAWLRFPETITVAVIPFGPSSRQIAASARARGFGVMIHVPMEPESPVPDRTETFRLGRSMSAAEMDARFARMVGDVNEATGASNHMGSAFTADPEAMASFAALLKARGFFFLDSLTSSRSVAAQTAAAAGVPAVRRDLFLDVGGGADEMRRRWEKAVDLARERGTAILVCHARLETLRTMIDLVPELRLMGIRAVTMDELMEDRAAVARLRKG